MIPATYLSRMGLYDFTIGGVNVRAQVIVDPKLVDHALAELELTADNPFVGLDLKTCRDALGRRRCALLILCTNTKCLIIQLDRMTKKSQNTRIPCVLGEFLSDKCLCFVSPNGFTKRTSGLSFRENANVVTLTQFCRPSRSPRVFECKRIWAVEVGEYAARVLKNPKLLKCKSLEKLGAEAGVDLNTTALSDSGARAKWPSPEWDSKLFSEEEVVSVMYDAVACYLIVQKLLAS
ncbi:unnamed protein product [Cuscuta campestris]|uniref:3'-5' exonuclease domain-containing protein n=1 Tax=Cuscuta campestris TaxID=132261 RepID=A0A484M8N5_9ASTE|nr:unnamed protein product [Cuscuta campestris]